MRAHIPANDPDEPHEPDSRRVSKLERRQELVWQ